MPRTLEKPTTRVHIHVFTEDLEFIRATYGSGESLGQNKAMRMMIHRIVRELREKAAQTAVVPQTSDEEVARALGETQE